MEMTFDAGTYWAILAFALAVISGTLVGIIALWERKDTKAMCRLRIAAGLRADEKARMSEDMNDVLIRFVTDVSRRLTLGVERSHVPVVIIRRVQSWFLVHGKRAGLGSTTATAEGLVEFALRLGLGSALFFVILGACFSIVLSVIGLFVGFVFGFTAPFRAVLSRQRMRAALLERELSEMLEVVSLALRSGLSFDRGFQLYCQHFSSPFAQSCEAARRTWVYGLDSRENALRDLSCSYDSPQLERVVQNIVRSLRFGSSLADILESSALDVRQTHRAHVQERVAKAPVKMMIPTGTLILPAMLLLVLGPVLLELMGGF